MRRVAAIAMLLSVAGCDDPPEVAPPPSPGPAAEELGAEDRAVRGVKAYVDQRVDELVAEGEALCAAAPEPDTDGWDLERDEESVLAMRAAWRRMRDRYESVEGAVQILFPQHDLDLDGRLEHYAELGHETTPFDRHGFVGMHAVERVLWSDSSAPRVLAFERALLGYVEARFPRDEAEARAFREQLCGRLVDDLRDLRDQLGPLALDAATAWRGIQGSIEEQAEKVLFAATGQTESRYARQTLADMRANLAGGRAVLEAFAPALDEQPQVADERARIVEALAALEALYASIDGDALPLVPEGFDPDAPSGDGDYARLHRHLARASDPAESEALLATLRRVGRAMDIDPIAR